jgi:hypothetical protein
MKEMDVDFSSSEMTQQDQEKIVAAVDRSGL